METPFSCRILGIHDWTVTEKQIQKSVLDMVESVKNAQPWSALRPVIVTEECRKCGKVRVRVINDV